MPRHSIRSAGTAMIAALSCAVVAPAGDDAVSWSFSGETSGEDVFWVSPDSIDPNASSYEAVFELTDLRVIVSYLSIPFGPFSVLDEIPEEFRISEGTYPGPAPFVLVDEELTAPLPPDPAAVSAHVRVELDGDGFGRLAMTDVFLGTFEVDLGPPFGTVTTQLETILFGGTIDVVALGPPCNADCSNPPDGLVNVSDLLAVLDAWGTKGGPCDVDHDGIVAVGDVLAVLGAWGPCSAP